MLHGQKEERTLKISAAPPRGRRTLGPLPFVALLVLLATAGGARAQTWTQQAPTGGPPPFRCYGASTVYAPASNRMILFGGRNCSGSGSYNDTWVLTNADGTGGTPQWIQLSTSGLPTARNNHSAVYDAVNDRMIIFAGCVGTCTPVFNDVWVLTNASGVSSPSVWMQLSIPGTQPA